MIVFVFFTLWIFEFPSRMGPHFPPHRGVFFTTPKPAPLQGQVSIHGVEMESGTPQSPVVFLWERS